MAAIPKNLIDFEEKINFNLTMYINLIFFFEALVVQLLQTTALKVECTMAIIKMWGTYIF